MNRDREASADLQELLDEIRHKQHPHPPDLDGERTNYERFLETLLKGKHPPFCELVWNGEAYHITLLIHFQKSPEMSKPPPPETLIYRQEAYRRFKKIGPAEQHMVSIRVTIKNWLPVTAELTIRPEAAGVLRLGTAQLLDFQNP